MRLGTVLAAIAFAAAAPAYAQHMQEKPMQGHSMEHMMEHRTPITKAIAVLSPVPGGKVEGTVTFEAVDGGVKVVADVTGLTPGKHGFHIHEYGDCSAPDFTSTGGHFMIPGEMHGPRDDSTSHKGDMGNLTADASGHAHLEWVDSRISLMGPLSIIGHGVIVHEKEDDLKTQPTGNAGGRVACGVIGIAK
jgi:Cu-Zn family superoxide dismutase